MRLDVSVLVTQEFRLFRCCLLFADFESRRARLDQASVYRRPWAIIANLRRSRFRLCDLLQILVVRELFLAFSDSVPAIRQVFHQVQLDFLEGF